MRRVSRYIGLYTSDMFQTRGFHSPRLGVPTPTCSALPSSSMPTMYKRGSAVPRAPPHQAGVTIFPSPMYWVRISRWCWTDRLWVECTMTESAMKREVRGISFRHACGHLYYTRVLRGRPLQGPEC
eukprot:1189838-Prorocentrum_minimum.AAC.5